MTDDTPPTDVVEHESLPAAVERIVAEGAEPADDEDAHGHHFYLQFASRGHSHLHGVPDSCSDANWVSDPMRAVVRGHSLSSALRRAADLPLSQWSHELGDFEPEDWAAWSQHHMEALALPEGPFLLTLTVDGQQQQEDTLQRMVEQLRSVLDGLGRVNDASVIVLVDGTTLSVLSDGDLAQLGLVRKEADRG